MHLSAAVCQTWQLQGQVARQSHCLHTHHWQQCLLQRLLLRAPACMAQQIVQCACIKLDISFKVSAGIHCQQGHNIYSGHEVPNCSKLQTYLKATCSWLDSMYFAFNNLLNKVLEWFLRPVEASAYSTNNYYALWTEA